MDGALTRITPSNESLVVSLQHGGGSKDTWILSDGPGEPDDAAAVADRSRFPSAAAAAICPAASPTICFGWGATRSGRKRRCAWRAVCSRS